MKKGFTLVEMLAVVVILGLVLIIAIPQIQNEVSNKKSSVQEASLKIIYDAAELYVESDISTFDNTPGKTYCIHIQDLVDRDYLEETITNFEDGTKIELTRAIKVTVNAYKEFEFDLMSSTSC